MSEELSFTVELEQVEDFCVVTDSVRRGIPVHVKVVDAHGALIYQD